MTQTITIRDTAFPAVALAETLIHHPLAGAETEMAEMAIQAATLSQVPFSRCPFRQQRDRNSESKTV